MELENIRLHLPFLIALSASLLFEQRCNMQRNRGLMGTSCVDSLFFSPENRASNHQHRRPV